MNITGLKLRLAENNDAQTIAGMSRVFVEDGLEWTWNTRKVKQQIEDNDSIVLVAMEGRHMAGFAIMQFGDDAAHLNLLAVHPEYRMAGVGRKLVRWLEKSARVAGVFSITLEVRESNDGAQRFYSVLGYQETGRLSNYYQGLENAVRLHSDLTTNVDADAG